LKTRLDDGDIAFIPAVTLSFLKEDEQGLVARTPTVKIDKSLYARYFQSNQSAKEVQDIVEKALQMYFEQG